MSLLGGSHRLVIKDAFWQIMGRIISALCGFVVIKIISPYLGPLRYGDYSTILKYFAIWSALADFGLYVIAVRGLGNIKDKIKDGLFTDLDLKKEFGNYVGTRIVIMIFIYTFALVLAYFLPAYTSNLYLTWGLPIGMLFSATFMGAGILQLPLQIFWKMEHLSIALVLARICQISFLAFSVYVLFDNVIFDGNRSSVWAFFMIMISVLISALVQGIYVWKKSQNILPLKINFDFNFIKNIIKSNRKYGLSYYLSSFHTLIVLIFLSLFFPTSKGYTYVGIWALALALIEILLIIPSALGNSMLHKISNYDMNKKLQSLGNFLKLIFWVGGVVCLNFYFFNYQIVSIVGSKEYIGTSFLDPGSNIILPFLAIVLWLSFIKQVFNYTFVATDKQNVLLYINFFGVLFGVVVGLYVIPKYNILGGVITQILLEVLFVLGSIFIAKKHSIMPSINFKIILKLFLYIFIVFSVLMLLYSIFDISDFLNKNIYIFLVFVLFVNLIIVFLSFLSIKKIARGLTVE